MGPQCSPKTDFPAGILKGKLLTFEMGLSRYWIVRPETYLTG